MKNYSREIGQALFGATGFCANHIPQLHPLLLPLAKICPTCGRKEVLRGDELSWPWIAPTNLPAKKSSIKYVRTIGITGITLLSVLVIKQITSLPGPKSSTELLVATRDRLNHSETSRTPDQKLALESRILEGDGIAGNESPLKAPAQVETDPSHGSADLTDELGSNQTRQAPPLENQATIQTDGNIPNSTAISPVLSQETQSQPGKTEESEPTRGSPNHTLGETAQATRLHQTGIEKRIAQAIAIRAIGGVTVFFDGSTAFLKGLVRTESQKLAAEQAARAVPGVKKVNSRIRVDWSDT